ncbi:MAG: protein-methionine-sulfoxide reductase catalytic subunit MsrP [Cyanobacteria bacterium P01_C01_bin.72]
MTLIRIPQAWEISENQITSPRLYYNRRSFIKTLIGAGIGASLLPLAGCQNSTSGIGKSASATELEKSIDLPKIDFTKNPNFQQVDRPITDEKVAAQYNNFYEFGGTKRIWLDAQKLPTENWKVEVGGLVNNPQTYDLDDLKRKFSQEERVYRFRCVEAWSMVLPWIGFPMKALLADVEPTAKAKFVSFTSFYDPEITKGPGFHIGSLPWPYTEGLRIEEMANDLAFFATGIFGHDLPKQHGAPIRMVIPWKYGFKGAKSIVKIEFLAEQPATYWNTLDSNEYKFEANVNPTVPHPRWSQATEKFISNGPGVSWKIKETLTYNGYGRDVADLYA